MTAAQKPPKVQLTKVYNLVQGSQNIVFHLIYVNVRHMFSKGGINPWHFLPSVNLPVDL